MTEDNKMDKFAALLDLQNGMIEDMNQNIKDISAQQVKTSNNALPAKKINKENAGAERMDSAVRTAFEETRRDLRGIVRELREHLGNEQRLVEEGEGAIMRATDYIYEFTGSNRKYLLIAALVAAAFTIGSLITIGLFYWTIVHMPLGCRLLSGSWVPGTKDYMPYCAFF